MLVGLLERRDAGDGLADDQGVDVVSAFVGDYGLEVHHVAHDGVVFGDAVAAEDLAGGAGAFEGHPDVVALGEGDDVVAQGACVFHAAGVEGEQLSFADFGDHPDEALLDELVAGDWLVAELFAHEGILERGVIAGHGGADGSPADAVAGLVEAHEGALEASGAGQQVGRGDADFLQGEAGGHAGAQGPLAVDLVGLEAGAVGFDEEAATRSSSSVTLAQMMATSAIVPLVIHIFSPVRMYSSPSRVARVVMPPGLEPKLGSVRPKQPSLRPAASSGSHFCFCSSVPKVWMGYMTRADWTLTKLRKPESPRSNSCMTRPYSTLDMPAQP